MPVEAEGCLYVGRRQKKKLQQLLASVTSDEL